MSTGPPSLPGRDINCKHSRTMFCTERGRRHPLQEGIMHGQAGPATKPPPLRGTVDRNPRHVTGGKVNPGLAAGNPQAGPSGCCKKAQLEVRTLAALDTAA